MANVAYYRVSTTDLNVDNQRREVEKLYKIDKEFVDDGISGTVLGSNREGFLSMLNYVREGDTLVVVDVDRIGRDSIDVQTNVQRLLDAGVNVIVTRLGIDLSTDAGQLIVMVLSKIAEMERKKLLERQAAGIERAKAEGKYKGRKPTVDADEVRRLRSEGVSITKVAEQLGCSVATVKRLQKEAV